MKIFLFLTLVFAAPAMAETFSRIALGSCADENMPQPVWNGILATDPDLFVFLGDNVYADTASMTEMQAAYDQLAAIEGYQRLRASVPVEAIWDDHDYGLNDGGREYKARVDSQQLFLDFFDEPENSERRQTPGIYTAREYGPPEARIQMILLDTRYFRSPWVKSFWPGRRYKAADDPELTMLGEAQWTWLEAQLRKPAKLRLIASGIQIINDEQGYETWGNFPLERQRLFDLISKTGAAGVMLLSGDRHFSEIAEIDAGVGYPLLELTSSGMTHPWADGPKEAHSNRLTAFGGVNFGLITVDWSQTDPLIRVAIHDVDGAEVTAVARPLSALTP